MKVIEPDALLCSNTSTLPITELADGVDRPADFIGLHFFSPVDKMPLVEIIRGERTSDAALAKAFDVTTGHQEDADRRQRQPRLLHQPGDRHVHQRGRGDGRRGHRPADGRAGVLAGRLPGPGAAADGRADPHAAAEDPQGDRRPRSRPRAARGTAHPSESVIDQLVEAGRPGKSGGAGFYEYADGKRMRLWPGLRTELGATNHDVDLHELSERMLFVEAIETQKCLDEGVLTSVAGRQHRLDLRHRLPAVDRRRGAVRRGLPGRRRRASSARADEFAAEVRRALRRSGEPAVARLRAAVPRRPEAAAGLIAEWRISQPTPHLVPANVRFRRRGGS